jgi:hypothetical protein
MGTKVVVKSIARLVDAAFKLTGIQPPLGSTVVLLYKYSGNYAKMPYKVLALALGAFPCISRLLGL